LGAFQEALKAEVSREVNFQVGDRDKHVTPSVSSNTLQRATSTGVDNTKTLELMLDLERKMEGRFRDYGTELRKDITQLVGSLEAGDNDAVNVAKRLSRVEEYQNADVSA